MSDQALTKVTFVLVLVIATAFAQNPLIYLSHQEAKDLPTSKLIEAFSNKQGEIIGKIFSHYAELQVKGWAYKNMPEA